jgi:predicted DNA-binding transcriptional regulator YafY
LDILYIVKKKGDGIMKNYRTTRRILSLIDRIKGGEPVNSTILAKEFGVDSRTSQRDMAFLVAHFGRDRIAYDRAKKSYIFR